MGHKAQIWVQSPNLGLGASRSECKTPILGPKRGIWGLKGAILGLKPRLEPKIPNFRGKNGDFHPKIPNLRGFEPNDPKSLGGNPPILGQSCDLELKTPKYRLKKGNFGAKSAHFGAEPPDLSPKYQILGEKMGFFHPKIPNLRGLEPNDPKSLGGNPPILGQSCDLKLKNLQYWLKKGNFGAQRRHFGAEAQI